MRSVVCELRNVENQLIRVVFEIGSRSFTVEVEGKKYDDGLTEDQALKLAQRLLGEHVNLEVLA